MKIAISSGKGGTGKTFIAVNLAAVLSERRRDITFLDCDVEAPNAHLFLKPTIQTTEPLSILSPVRIDPVACSLCGRCVTACNYNALAKVKDRVLLYSELCHACGACSLVCSMNAIFEAEKPIGHIDSGIARERIAFHTGLLKTGVGGMSPRIIKALKRRAGHDVTLLDSPPGTTCPTVETISDVDLCVLVSDPTPFSVHDLKLSVNMCRTIGIEPVVVINRAGIDDTDIKQYCVELQLDIIGEIPDDRRIAEVYSGGSLAVDSFPDIRSSFETLADKIIDPAHHRRPAKRELIRSAVAFETDASCVETETTGDTAPQTGIKEITIISGKGGTGKTSIAACFANLNSPGMVADCDVDASVLHLILDPLVVQSSDFAGSQKSVIRDDRCAQYGRCADVCRFGAIDLVGDGRYQIDAIRCEGCGACRIVCPAKAIDTVDTVAGKMYLSRTRFGRMSHAELGPAEENSGRLVTLVRQDAARLATSNVVIDGSPGTGCPVIASVTGASLVVMVAEATVSGVSDLVRVLELARHFRVPAAVIINKSDINREMSERIRTAAETYGAIVLGDIKYDRAFIDAQLKRQTLMEFAPDSETAKKIRAIWDAICDRLKRADSTK